MANPSILSELEHRAYAAAHAVMAIDHSSQLACRGARNTAAVDRVAAVILSHMDGIGALRIEALAVEPRRIAAR